jgi:hypothetical protein
MSKKPKSPTAAPSKAIGLPELRAFIWASPRMAALCPGAHYYLFNFTPTPEKDLTEVPANIERHGATAAFDYLYGHANIERAKYGYWAVGHRANKTLKIFDDLLAAAAYAEMLREVCLAEAARPDLH